MRQRRDKPGHAPEERLVELEVEGHRLAGILHMPESARQPCPVVVYCPGKNGERYEVHRLAVKFARRLAERGIACLRFDYYGLGLSDGWFHEMTTSTKIRDTLAALRFVRETEGVDPGRIAFLGFSDGARIALMSAVRTGISRLLLWSPLFSEFGGNFPGGRKPRFFRHPLYPDAMVKPWAGLWVGMDFYRDLQQIDIGKELLACEVDSLLIYGTDDPLIEEEFAYMETTRYPIYSGTTRHQVSPVEGAGHLFTSVRLEEKLMDESFGWLAASFGLSAGTGKEETL
ncbi:alpha/beta hydrolase [Paenibacillus chitinolyticus]|uniref:alpha/beta hydrolase n=1 Tax=Paenibacillus chitinolyticus TaxID=79263 RepID=UPI003649ADA7